MRLSEFIVTSSEKILSEWEAFARSLAAADTMDIAALRDHAREMLATIARDLETPQTKQEAADKSKGQSDTDSSTPDTPAQEHGSGRAESGFSMVEMMSEYRALRASVIRLWTKEKGGLDASDIEDLIRFSEAIDQAVAESTSSFSEDLDRTKETFLGILAHDLRTPLGAVITSAKFMVQTLELPATAQTLTARIVSSGERMIHMVDDLLDFTRSRLGASIPIVRAQVDMAKVVTDAVEEAKASRPDTDVRLETSGDLRGEWDSARMSQVLSNLIGNAINHGSATTPITVTAHGEADAVVISVHNLGRPIPKDQLPNIFNPLTGAAPESRDPKNHLGLGLYIAERVVAGHGGTIAVDSTEARGTTFTVRLPRTDQSHGKHEPTFAH